MRVAAEVVELAEIADVSKWVMGVSVRNRPGMAWTWRHLARRP